MADNQTAPGAYNALGRDVTSPVLQVIAPVEGFATFPMFRAAAPLCRAVWQAETGVAMALCE